MAHMLRYWMHVHRYRTRHCRGRCVRWALAQVRSGRPPGLRRAPAALLTAAATPPQNFSLRDRSTPPQEVPLSSTLPLRRGSLGFHGPDGPAADAADPPEAHPPRQDAADREGLLLRALVGRNPNA